jgi:hypothetical protein
VEAFAPQMDQIKTFDLAKMKADGDELLRLLKKTGYLAIPPGQKSPTPTNKLRAVVFLQDIIAQRQFGLKRTA